MPTITPPNHETGDPTRLRTSNDSPAVPRVIRAAAYAVPLCVLPSAAWRVGRVIRWAVAGPGACDTGGVGQAAYMVLLSLLSMSAALLTVGLVRPWGERLPGWLPLVGRREVPARSATIAAFSGAGLMALITLYALTKDALGIAYDAPPPPPGCEPPGMAVALAYVPLPLWSPLLFTVAVHYRRRRTERP